MLRFARSALFGLVCLVSLGVGITPSSAGDYPNRPVHWLVGFAAGGPVDIVARIMSQWLSDHLGQQFVVENRAGSGGNIAAAAAINSTPDGYTILFVAPNNAISTSLYKHLSYDFIRDTVPVASIGSHAGAERGPAGSSAIPSAIRPAPTKPPASPDTTFLTALAALSACPSTRIAAFTAATKAIMVTRAAIHAAHRGLAASFRTRMKTRAANGIATSAMRKSPGVPAIRSISGTISGVRIPDSTPAPAIFSRSLREVPGEMIAPANAHLSCCLEIT